ncbi:DUF1349 domain-containing protein [candidate division KSB3 bacterium]|uniref:DUF1349 domain-containing protein n=1 Tax=candidate division KSB3 bacterium TaxID=2044937 RepID=A0A9D5JTM3_9BACT|nr:DUF1349 domain-containing protein [candidate division KSB3 bacterium]MBD3323884.1 DUF1349 domain-containing protein [candidate division KSB3 bacterium]
MLPADWHVEDGKTLTMQAGPITDLFHGPRGDKSITNAPRAVFVPQEGDFLFRAKVDVAFQATFDAGVLLIYANDTTWAKLCLEFSPQRQPMIVSVVNRGLSDDCSSVTLEGREVYLRIARIGRAFAFHYSTDAQVWHLVRQFTLGEPPHLRIGFLAQAPTGDGCRVNFSNIAYESKTLTDIRSGE